MNADYFRTLFASWEIDPAETEELGGTAFRWSEYTLWVPGEGSERQMARLSRTTLGSTMLVMSFSEPTAFIAWLNAVDTP